MMRSKLLSYIFLFIAFQALGQDRYMVFFKDKSNTPYAIDRPQEFLSQKSIQRRIKNGISINESDLPVDPAYVQAIKDLDVEAFFTSKWMNAVIIQAQASRLPEIETLAFVDRIEYVAPNSKLSHSPSEFRSVAPILPNLDTIEPSARQNQMIGADVMLENEVKGQGVMIAIFDDGFSNYLQVPAFQHMINDGRVLLTKDFTTNANQVENFNTHGSRVLSILASDDGVFRGIAPESDYVLFITEAPGEYRVEEFNWLFAAEKADSAGVDIINSSLNYGVFQDPSMSYTPEDMDGSTTIVSQAAKWASAKGILVLSSAGNVGQTAWKIVLAPADAEGVLAIGAIDELGTRTVFSSTGPNANGQLKPDLVALGQGTALIDFDGKYRYQNGTSFSTPLVTGLAAGVLSENPELTRAQLFDLLIKSADNYDTPNNGLGYGVPHYSAIKNLLQLQSEVSSTDIKLFPNPVQNDIVRISIGEGIASGPMMLSIFNDKGVSILNSEINGTERLLSIDVSGYLPGVYLVRVNSSGGTAIKKLLIQY